MVRGWGCVRDVPLRDKTQRKKWCFKRAGGGLIARRCLTGPYAGIGIKGGSEEEIISPGPAS